MIADRLCELGERRGELMALQLARGDDAPGAESLWRNHGLMPQGVSLANCRFERGCLVQGRVEGPVDPADPAWLTMRSMRFETSFSFVYTSPFETKLPRLRELSGIREDDLPALIDRLPRDLEVFHCILASLESPFLTSHQRAFPKLRTLGFELLAYPKPALDRIISNLPPHLSLLWLPGYEYEPLAVQRALSNAPGLTVNLFFGDIEFNENAAWVAVNSNGLRLCEWRRHLTGPQFVDSARELMVASGVQNPTVHTEPKR